MILPPYVSYAISKIEAAGFSAYAVGGCIRDSLLGKTPQDWDITTSALPWEIQNIFFDEKTIPTGIKHGTITAIIDHCPLEITTFRIDGDYRDSRHPENVSFSANISDDLSRRDFTINAMAYNLHSNIIDLFSGQEDLSAKIIRAVGNPNVRFKEDALRIMRAIRFSAQLGFEIETETFSAMQTCKNRLENISAERITSEFSKTLAAHTCGAILNKTFDITKAVFFGEAPTSSPQAFEVLDKIPCDIALRLAGYIILSAAALDVDCLALAKNFFSRMKFTNQIKNTVLSILAQWDTPLPDARISVRQNISRMGFDVFKNLLTLKTALTPTDTTRAIEFFDQIVKNNDCCDLKNLAVTGRDLSGFSLSGKETGDALHFLLDAVIHEHCKNERSALIEYFKEFLIK